METKANHLLIGGFVLLVTVLGFGFVYWMQNYGAGAATTGYHILFRGSVNGLTRASNVLFNGLKVGKVQDMAIDSADARDVRVLVRIDGGVPIRSNSRARIQAQGLTGVAAIQITAGTPDAPLLTAKDGQDYPVIKADRATSESLFSAAPEVLGNANALFIRLNDLIANNEDSIRRTVTNVESFTTMLETHKGDVGSVIKDARALTAQFKRMSAKLETAIDNFSGYMTDDGESVLAQAKEAVESFRKLAQKLDKAFGQNADGIARFAKTGIKEFELFMRDGRRAARSLDRVLERIERNPQSFLFGGSRVPEYNPRR